MPLQPKSVPQVAALPFVPQRDGVEVLLVTSRHGGRWILPKGWPSGNCSLAEAARREADEEAGVVGDLRDEPVGRYSYSKRMPEGYRVRCEVFVFPLLVREHRVDWRERGERALRWCAPAEAARLVEDRGLQRLLADLSRDAGASLCAAVTADGGTPWPAA